MTELEYEQLLKEAYEKRKYPRIEEQLDTLYRVMTENGEVNEFTEMIRLVKESAPKPIKPTTFDDAESPEDASFAPNHNTDFYPSSKF